MKDNEYLTLAERILGEKVIPQKISEEDRKRAVEKLAKLEKK